MAQALYTIAPDAPFLATLAQAILAGPLLGDWPRHGPFWLADVTIFLPTRRARLALAEIFMAKLGGTLLPDIRTFGGDIGEEELFLPPTDAPGLVPPVSALERRLTLGRLIAAWAQTPEGGQGFSSPPNASEILALADSLGTLIDDFTIEGVDPRALGGLAPEALAANWQQTLGFLDIALKSWPDILNDRGKGDAAHLRNLRLEREAGAVAALFADRPVIAAGSTGSVPATATLLAALTRLPRGALVLPGLDTGLSAADHERLLDVAKAPHGHPQYGLARLLDRLKANPGMVEELATGPRPARTLIVRKALALAADSANWARERAALGEATAAGIAGVTIICARTPDREARAIALAARAALEATESVGIVSPDQNLARRIASELRRFDIDIDDAAGTPLFHSGAGRLARQILSVVASEFGPVDLMALISNRALTLGLARGAIARLAPKIEMGLLRGQRPRPGIAGLRRTLADNISRVTNYLKLELSAGDGVEIAAFFDRLEAAMAPIVALGQVPMIEAAQLGTALGETFRALTAPPEGEIGIVAGAREFAAWTSELAERVNEGPNFPPRGLDKVLFALMAGHEVRRPASRTRADIAIWGQLEARLQNPDVLILAGLNEDIWPRPADPGPWLSRGMRVGVGLEPPERDQGRAAHDFEMGMGNGTVILAYAERLGTSPALPSRLIQRLDAFLGEDAGKQMRARGQKWIEAARRLDAADKIESARRPLPRPPAALRPRRLSVTEIETLFRSPYDLYARHVLKLRPLDPLGEAPGARERGSMIHEVFSRFVNENCDFFALDAQATLETMALAAFEGLEAIEARRDIWLRRFSRAAELFLAFERARAGQIASRHAEINGDWGFPELDNFHLTGRADRVDRRTNGSVEILDFKTGAPPSSAVMKGFEAPQLLLEAGMARAGALKDLAPGSVEALTYIKIGLGPEAFVVTPFKLAEGFDLETAADEISARLQRHVKAILLSDKYAMTARIRPDVGQRYRGVYEHLARTDEWTLGGEMQ